MPSRARKNSSLSALAMGLLLAAGGVYALASYDWCGPWPPKAPEVLLSQSAAGPLHVGVAKVALAPPYPVVVAGYAPLRPEVSRAELPPFARALVMKAGALKVGLVSVDLLHVPDSLVAQIRDRTAKLGLSMLWVSATHAHSSMGAFDCRLVAEVAATGSCRAQAQQAVVAAASSALETALESLRPATLSLGETQAAALVYPRTGQAADERLSRLLLRDAQGPLAQVLIFSAHPTLVPRKPQALHADYPGALAEAEEAAGHGVTLFLVGAGGNASIVGGAEGPVAYAATLSKLAGELPLELSAEPTLGFTTVRAYLPRPDGSRLVPTLLRGATDNILCSSTNQSIELTLLRLGPWSLLGAPLEPTFGAGRRLEAAAGASRVVGLTNGYSGYLEEEGLVAENSGEAKRQYFGPQLLGVLEQAAKLFGAGR